MNKKSTLFLIFLFMIVFQRSAGAQKLNILITYVRGDVTSEVGDTTFVVNTPLTLHAGLYSDKGRFREDISVNWFWSDTATANPATEFLGSGIALVFRPTWVDTGFIHVQSLTKYPNDSTGVMTIVPGPLNKIVIRDEALNGGFPIENVHLNINEPLELHAAGYDTFDNFLGDQIVRWSSTGLIPEVDALDRMIHFNPTRSASGKIYASMTIDANSSGDSTGVITVHATATLDLKIYKPVPSQIYLNQGQHKDWSVELVVQNRGSGDLELNLAPDQSNLYFSLGSDYLVIPPTSLQEGGIRLPASSRGSLRYIVSETGASAGPCRIHAFIRAREVGTGLDVFENTEPDSGCTVFVQTPARLRINSVAIAEGFAPNQPHVNQGESIGMMVNLSNLGQEDAMNVVVSMSSDGNSSIESPQSIGMLTGLGNQQVNFPLSISQDAGTSEKFFARIESAVAVNIDSMTAVAAALDSTEQIIIQRPAQLIIDDIKTQSDTLPADQRVNLALHVILRNDGEAGIQFIADPGIGEVRCLSNGEIQDDYTILRPTSLASGEMELPAGAEDSLLYMLSTTGLKGGDIWIRFDFSRHASDMNNDRALSVIDSVALFIQTSARLEITSTSIHCPNRNIEGDGEVNAGQAFQVEVVAKNTGGEDIGDVWISMTSTGTSRYISPVSQVIPLLQIRESKPIFFEMIADSLPIIVEQFTATIDSATAILSGGQAVIVPALDGMAHIQIEYPASPLLQVDAVHLQVPLRVEFELTAEVINRAGCADYDSSGWICLRLPSGFQMIDPDSCRSFHPGEKVLWKVMAPDVPRDQDTLFIFIGRQPRDVNDPDQFVQISGDSVRVTIEVLETFLSIAEVAVIEPPGAVDRILSTDQRFNVRAKIDRQQVEDVFVKVIHPEAFRLLDDPVQFLENRTELIWRFRAPGDAAVMADTLFVEAWGRRKDDDYPIHAIPDTSLQLLTVEKTDLRVRAEITHPAEAVSGAISPGLEFQISGDIVNSGTAGTTGLQSLTISIDPRDVNSLTILDEATTTVTGHPVVWRIRAAADLDAQPKIIHVRMKDIPFDQNSDSLAYIAEEHKSVQIVVYTAAESELMVRQIAGIAPMRIVPGESFVLLGIEFSNLAAPGGPVIDILGLKVNVEDVGFQSIDPSSVVSVIRIENQESSVLGECIAPVVNPVEIHLIEALPLLPQESVGLYIAAELKSDLDKPFLMNLKDSSYIQTNLGGNLTFVDASRNPMRIFNFRSEAPMISLKRLQDSFLNYPNPFGTEERAITHFIYYLDMDTDVDFTIYTLLGEIVFRQSFDAKQWQGKKGLHQGMDLTWDGVNMKGEVVLNGVYIARIETASGEQATTKVAVLK